MLAFKCLARCWLWLDALQQVMASTSQPETMTIRRATLDFNFGGPSAGFHCPSRFSFGTVHQKWRGHWAACKNENPISISNFLALDHCIDNMVIFSFRSGLVWFGWNLVWMWSGTICFDLDSNSFCCQTDVALELDFIGFDLVWLYMGLLHHVSCPFVWCL